MEARVPITMTASLALHLAGGVAWLQVTQANAKAPMRVIGNVDLLIRVRQAPTQVAQARPKPPPPSAWNFLKMALPSIPKAAGPIDVKPLEVKRDKPLDVPDKLEQDKGRLERLAKLEALDLGRKKANAARLDVGDLEAQTRRAIPSDLPKLEEVGTRRASAKALQLAALAEEERGRLQPQGLDALAALPKVDRGARQPAPLLSEEAAPLLKKGILGKMADMLSSEPPALKLGPQAAPAIERVRPQLNALQQALPKKEDRAQLSEKKKAMEIEGPIASRRLVYYELPTFPQWLATQGVVEAEVRIKFFVTPPGDVAPDMRVETTSGYGRLDRLAMDSLKSWRFEPVEGAGRQWGIITFRFLLE